MWSLLVVIETNGRDTVQCELAEVLRVERQRAFVRGTFADGARFLPVRTHRPSQGQIVAVAED